MFEALTGRIKVFLLSLILVFTMAGCGDNRERDAGKHGKIEVRISHVMEESTPKGQAALKFREALERTGKFKVQVFPASELYGDKEELEALRANNVQLIAPLSTKLVGFVPSLQLVDIPFLFRDNQAAYNFYDSETCKKLMQPLEYQGMLGLAWWSNGSKHYTNSKRALKTPADFKDLKFCTQLGGIPDEHFRSLGASSRTVPLEEVYHELNKKTVDGQENTYYEINSRKYEQVQKHLTVSGHGRVDYVVLTNTTFWNSLTPEEQKLFMDAMKEATAFERKLADDLNAGSFLNLQKSGKLEIYTLSEADRQAFIKALEPLYNKYTDIIGREFIDAARNNR